MAFFLCGRLLSKLSSDVLIFHIFDRRRIHNTAEVKNMKKQCRWTNFGRSLWYTRGMKYHHDDPAVATHVAHVTHRKAERLTYLESLTPSMRMAVFNELSPTLQRDVLDHAPVPFVVQLIDHFDPDRAHVYLRRITSAARRTRITNELRRELKQKVEQFTAFHVRAAHELVHFNYILLPHTTTIEEAAEAIAVHRAETGRIPEVLVRKNGVCIGEIEPRALILHPNSEPLGHATTGIHTLPHTATATDVAALAMNSAIQKIVITDASDDSVVGIVYTHEIIDLFEEKPKESLYNFAGLEENEHPFDSAFRKVSARTKWLIVNLGTTFLAAFVITLFHSTLAAIAILAVFMPVISGMASNAGTQTFAVFIRGLTLGEITLKNALPALRNEILAVLMQGALHTSILTLITFVLGYGVGIGLVAGLAVAFGMFVGVIAGSLIPLILHKLGKDPALSSGIIITTFTDVAGLLALFGLAAIFLLS